jgi:hypothetical protein
MRGIITYTDFEDGDGMLTVYGPDNHMAWLTALPKPGGRNRMYLWNNLELVADYTKGILKARIEKIKK